MFERIFLYKKEEKNDSRVNMSLTRCICSVDNEYGIHTVRSITGVNEVYVRETTLDIRIYERIIYAMNIRCK